VQKVSESYFPGLLGMLNNNSGSGDYAYPDYQDEGSWTGTKQ
jgi:hypothetical protein